MYSVLVPLFKYAGSRLKSTAENSSNWRTLGEADFEMRRTKLVFFWKSAHVSSHNHNYANVSPLLLSKCKSINPSFSNYQHLWIKELWLAGSIELKVVVAFILFFFQKCITVFLSAVVSLKSMDGLESSIFFFISS